MTLNSPHQPRAIRPRLVWLVFLLLGLLAPASATTTKPEVVHIGVVKSIFRDIPAPVVSALMVPFASLLNQETGLNGQIVTTADAFDQGEQLDKGKLDLGVFHGFEFAWAQERFPKLRPLMLAVNQHTYMAVHLVTREDSEIAQFADLKGKKLSLPNRSREHCYLYSERHCEKAGCTAAKFFSKVVKHGNVEDALDDVVRGEVAGAIVDSLSLECYSIVKPGCMALLKTVEKTELFPAAVVAYREGSLDEKILDAFRSGMLNAKNSPKSRGLMGLFKLTSFEEVPDDYQQGLTNIRKAYPAPAALVLKMAEPTKVDSQ